MSNILSYYQELLNMGDVLLVKCRYVIELELSSLRLKLTFLGLNYNKQFSSQMQRAWKNSKKKQGKLTG